MKKTIQWIKNHKLIIIIGMIIIFGVFYFEYNKSGESVEKNTIKTVNVSRGDITVSVSGTGQVAAGSQVDLKPQVAGDGLNITELHVEDNQEVKKGDLIAVLDTSDIDQKIRSAALSVQSAEISLKQAEENFDKQTKDDKYQRQAREVLLAQDQVNLNNYYEDRDDYYIRATANGTVTGLDFEIGDSISRTEILASVISDDVKAEISLNEVDAVMVKIGNSVQLTFDALDGVKATGKVSKVDTIGRVDGGVVTYDVEISFESPSELLKPGMSTNVEIYIASVENVLRVPQSVVKEDAHGKSYVMVSDGRDDSSGVTKKDVETGMTNDVMLEIKNGLSEGDFVVTKMIDGEDASKKENVKSDSAGSILPVPGSGRGQGPGR